MSQPVVARASFALLALFAWLPPLGRQPCKSCRGAGFIACRVKHGCTEPALWCSEAADCERCAGTSRVDCAECQFPEVEAELARNRALGAELAPFDAAVGRGVRKAASANVRLAWDLDALKLGSKKVKAHELMHVYLERLERVRADYLALVRARESDLEKPLLVAVWQSPADQKKAGKALCDYESEVSTKRLGSECVYSLCYDPTRFPSDEALHRHLVHNAAHLVMNHERPSLMLADAGAGWADEGVAHALERRAFGTCTVFCTADIDEAASPGAGDWGGWIQKRTADEEPPKLEALLARDTKDLGIEEHAIAWSLVEFLLATDPAKLDLVLKRLRTRLPARDAIQESYGWTPKQLQQRWEEWARTAFRGR
jgi:hypothetical protein